MRGHEPLIALRRAGSVPDWVFFNTDADDGTWRDWQDISIRRAQIQIDPNDKRLDLRFVIGLPCYVTGSDVRRVLRVRDALIEAKASRVIASVMEQIGEGEFVAFRVTAVSDTDNHMTYETEPANG